LTRALALGGILYVLWLLLSGYFEPLLLSFGVLSVALSVYIGLRMDLVDHEGLPVQLSPGLLTYLPWLFNEVVKANIAVVRIILHPALPISPSLVRFKGTQRTDLGRFIFANSITLTPGTITVGVDGPMLEVHALAWELVDGTEEGPMDQRVTALEG
jgi:multicomponent Na+:H+ antiporter subunit E